MFPDMIKVTVGDSLTMEVKKGTLLNDLLKLAMLPPQNPILGAIMDNEVSDLWQEVKPDSKVIFIDRTHPDGCRMLTRGFNMVLVKAVHETFSGRGIYILHSLSKGLFFRWANGDLMRKDEINKIEKRIREIIKADYKIEKSEVTKEEATEIFEKAGMMDKVKLLKFRRKKTLKIHTCNGYTNYFFGRLPPSTGTLGKFEIKYYRPGAILRFSCSYSPDIIPIYKEQRKLAQIYSEYKRWTELMEVSDVASLNDVIMNGDINDLIRVAEAFHEKKIAHIADEITRNAENIKIVPIAGPSSSGKTTFAQRLMVQLRVNGIKPVTLSLDDYFVDKEKTPKNENGSYDFEHIEAIDLSLFNEHLQKLLSGEEVKVPRFDFKKGKRVENHRNMQLAENSILIIEGIHSLNEKLTESIPSINKYKIYINALTALNLDNHNRIPTTDTRIIRRIVRDSRFRNHTAAQTIYQWPSVRRGEDRYIFPFQEEADVMFNSALIYELSVLKGFVEPLLREITPAEPAYAEAKRLLSFVDNFIEVGTDEIPPNSILREFIGATCFFKMDVL